VNNPLVLLLAALLVVGLILSGRALARHHLRRLRRRPADQVWAALGTAPDGRATVVAFSTPACAACRSAQKPALSALQEQAADRVRVIEVDAASRPEVARAFGILTVPATVVLDPGGAVQAANQGFATTAKLAAQVELGKPADRST
jgi:thiol-disulfide isomerase/thioredoxin